MNILHLNTEINFTCGVSRVIFQIMSHKHPQINSSVLCFGGNGLSRFYDNNMNVYILKNKYFFHKYIYHFIKIIFYCKRNNIEVLHSHHRYFDFLAFFISKILGVKTLMSVHSKVYDKKRLSYLSQRIIAVSETIKVHLHQYYGIKNNKIVVINNYVDFDEQTMNNKKIIRQKLNIPPNKFLITFIGRFTREKGIDILIESIIKLKNEEIYFLFVGEGEEEKFINAVISKMNLPISIISSREGINDYYIVSDIIILPSRVDSFPLVMVETGYFQKVFIGSKVDGIREFIIDGEDGILVDSEDVEGFANTIMYLIENKEVMDKLARNLNRKVIANYLFKNNFYRYEQLYLS